MSITINIDCETASEALSELAKLLAGHGKSTATVTVIEPEPLEVAPEGAKKAQVTGETVGDGEVDEPKKKRAPRRTKAQIELEKTMAAEAQNVEAAEADGQTEEVDHRQKARDLIDAIGHKHKPKGLIEVSNAIRDTIDDGTLKVTIKNVTDDDIEGLNVVLVKILDKDKA